MLITLRLVSVSEADFEATLSTSPSMLGLYWA